MSLLRELNRLGVLRTLDDVLANTLRRLDPDTPDEVLAAIEAAGLVAANNNGSGQVVAAGTLGEITGINARGSWLRDRAYYARAPWAGRRTLNGQRIADGVATNPLAHSIATALVVPSRAPGR